MVANWIVNASLGLTAFLFTYYFSLQNNTWQTALFRAGIGFLLFFILGIILRFILHQIISKKNPELSQKQNTVEESSPETERTNHVEEVPMAEPVFQSIPLDSLHTREEGKDPERVAHTIRT
ncbi:hypothetical protein COJ96_02015 [Bacillus sp. AFS073361]|uniref:hypothetical protein n=1 Tax=Bacillus sp. AFS073361 TaxID=2033511 RepID=UPI000BF8C208|nr:hypothetical protein [Bacillus sp. AFS073361]PFP30761.1 hypothetical protein COJ96_02015 [Bacillus sp. AFS073361]